MIKSNCKWCTVIRGGQVIPNEHTDMCPVRQGLVEAELPQRGLFGALDVLLNRKVTSDGSTASYYELPIGATELQHLISARNMNAQIGEIFRACYRYGRVEHSPEIRDIKKIIFYAQAELQRLERLK